MTYYLFDLYNKDGAAQARWKGNPMRFDTREALLAFWRTHCGYGWSELNITGNDIIMYAESHYFAPAPDGTLLARYIYAPYLRRYLVTDSDGRHQDIRDWDQNIMTRRPSFYGLYSTGSKQHWHRSNGPSMWRRTAQAAAEAAHQEDVDQEERVPPVRHKAMLTWLEQEDAYEKHCFGRRSRCWKDQSKAGSQYRRHAKASKGRQSRVRQSDDSLWESLMADGFPVCLGTAEAAA